MNDRDRFLNEPEPVEGLRAACLDLTGHLSSGPAAVRLARSLHTLLTLVIGALRPVAAAKSAATPSGELTPEHVLDDVRILRTIGDQTMSIDFIARVTGMKPENVEAAIATLVYSRQLEWADAAHETVRRVQPDLTAPTGVDSAKSYGEVFELIWTALCDHPKGLTVGRIHQLTALSPATIHRTLTLLDVELIEGEGDSTVSTAPRYRLRRTRDVSRVETMAKPADKPTAIRQVSATREDTMKSMTTMQLFSHYCRAAKLWGMMIRFTPPFTDDDWTGFRLACPYHKQLSVQHAFDGEAFLYFDTEEEMRALYEQTVGEDGPTKVNPYDGPFRVWAMTCGPDGRPRNENT